MVMSGSDDMAGTEAGWEGEGVRYEGFLDFGIGEGKAEDGSRLHYGWGELPGSCVSAGRWDRPVTQFVSTPGVLPAHIPAVTSRTPANRVSVYSIILGSNSVGLQPCGL